MAGLVTAWTDSEAQKHGCAGGANVNVDSLHDGYVVRLRPSEFIEVFLPWEVVESENEEQIRALIKEGCEKLKSVSREKLR